MVKLEDAVYCKKCGSYIRMDTGYDYIPCACGAIAVDGGEFYCRIIGQHNDWEIIAIPICKKEEE